MILHDEMSQDDVFHIRKHFRRSIQKSTISKKLITCRRFSKENLASHKQKKRFDAMQLMKKPISSSTDQC